MKKEIARGFVFTVGWMAVGTVGVIAYKVTGSKVAAFAVFTVAAAVWTFISMLLMLR